MYETNANITSKGWKLPCSIFMLKFAIAADHDQSQNGPLTQYV